MSNIFTGHTGRYLLATLILCSLTLLAQVVFQSYLLIVANESQPYGTILTNCKIFIFWLNALPGRPICKYAIINLRF